MALTEHLSEVFSCFSRLLNVLRGGTADLTLSASAHIERLAIEPYIDAFFFHVFGERNHCRIWWEKELERSHKNIERERELVYD